MISMSRKSPCKIPEQIPFNWIQSIDLNCENRIEIDKQISSAIEWGICCVFENFLCGCIRKFNENISLLLWQHYGKIIRNKRMDRASHPQVDIDGNKSLALGTTNEFAIILQMYRWRKKKMDENLTSDCSTWVLLAITEQFRGISNSTWSIDAHNFLWYYQNRTNKFIYCVEKERWQFYSSHIKKWMESL